jgi:hypothetical protein
LLRYSAKRNEIMDQKVQAIRRTRGAVRVGDELFLSTRSKESAEAILERLGFFDQAAARMPEEMLRFEGAEDESTVEEMILGEEEIELDSVSKPEELPESWLERGIKINEGATLQATFAAATNTTLDKWETRIRKQRTSLSLPGDPTRPITWDTQDWYVLSQILYCDILFVSRGPAGALTIDKWIEFNVPPTVNVSHMYMVFWNGKAVSRGKVFRFFIEDLPNDLTRAMDGASPLPDEEARTELPEVTEVPKPEVPKPEAPKPVIEQAGEAVVAADKTVTAAVDAAVDTVKKIFTGEVKEESESSEESEESEGSESSEESAESSEASPVALKAKAITTNNP